MQIYADVTGCTMLVAGSSQACALGSAISAAVLAGAHRELPGGAARDDAPQEDLLQADPAAGGPTTGSTPVPRAPRRVRGRPTEIASTSRAS
jgi:hypothetical protein